MDALNLNINTGILTESLRKQLLGKLKESPGASPVNLVLSDPKTGIAIQFISRKFKVSITSELIDSLKAAGIDVSLSEYAEPDADSPLTPTWDYSNTDF